MGCSFGRSLPAIDITQYTWIRRTWGESEVALDLRSHARLEFLDNFHVLFFAAMCCSLILGLAMGLQLQWMIWWAIHWCFTLHYPHNNIQPPQKKALLKKPHVCSKIHRGSTAADGLQLCTRDDFRGASRIVESLWSSCHGLHCALGFIHGFGLRWNQNEIQQKIYIYINGRRMTQRGEHIGETIGVIDVGEDIISISAWLKGNPDVITSKLGREKRRVVGCESRPLEWLFKEILQKFWSRSCCSIFECWFKYCQSLRYFCFSCWHVFCDWKKMQLKSHLESDPHPFLVNL